jgi:hypothetical protein
VVVARQQLSLSPRTIDLTRAIIDAVRLELDPLQAVDRVLVTVVWGRDDARTEDYRDALEQALASGVRLATLSSEYHPEVILRRYVAEVRRRLASIN